MLLLFIEDIEKKVEDIDRIILSTESKKIAMIAKKIGYEIRENPDS